LAAGRRASEARFLTCIKAVAPVAGYCLASQAKQAMRSIGAKTRTRESGSLALCAGGLLAAWLMFCPLAGAAPAQPDDAKSFLLTLRPTEGILLELTGSKDRAGDSSWHVDREQSSGLDHVDVVNVGIQPTRIAGGGTDAMARLKGLFEAPKVWGWGIRARSAGHADILLTRNASASESSSIETKVVHVDVVDEGRDAPFGLPLQQGERTLLEIWTNPSTGAQWRIDTAISTGLAFVKIKPGRTYDPSDPTDWLLRDRIGAPMLQEWQIEAAAAGTAHVALDYGPPWEKRTLYRQLRIDITVQALD